MTIKELYETKPFPITNVSVKKRLEELCEEIDSPMRCNINNVSLYDVTEDIYVLNLDFKPYEDFNKSVATPTFWDKDGNATLTWFETPYYKNGKVEAYVMGTDSLEDFFNKKDKYDLQNEFIKETNIWINLDENYPYQYTEWLEKKLLNE